MYYKNASAAVICFSTIEKASFEKAKFWIAVRSDFLPLWLDPALASD
jgi:hypothetical protein